MPQSKRATGVRSERPKRPAARKHVPRTALIREVEELWCALNSALARFQAQAAAERGLTMTDLYAVDVLAREGAVCASDLAEECGLTPGAVTGMLNRLERANVARRSRDQADARRLVIRPVDAREGRECRLPPALSKVAATFNESELRSIRRFLLGSVRVLRREPGK